MLSGDEAFICGRCGWLAIDDECGCTSVRGPAAGDRAASGVVWATVVAAALVIVAVLAAAYA